MATSIPLLPSGRIKDFLPSTRLANQIYCLHLESVLRPMTCALQRSVRVQAIKGRRFQPDNRLSTG